MLFMKYFLMQPLHCSSSFSSLFFFVFTSPSTAFFLFPACSCLFFLACRSDFWSFRFRFSIAMCSLRCLQFSSLQCISHRLYMQNRFTKGLQKSWLIILSRRC